MPTFLIFIIGFAVAIAAFDLFAGTTAMEKSSWSIVTYIWVGVWAAVGGLVSFQQKVRAGQTRWLNIGELAGELGTSAFIGIISGLLCEYANFPQALTWAIVGVTGHAGGRGIFWLERFLQRLAEKYFGVTPQDQPIKEEK